MKRTALLVALLAIGASLFALPASAKATGPTMAQFNALKGQVRSLQHELSCYSSVYPVTSWGDPTAGTEGYLYGMPDGSVYATTAIDFVNNLSGMTAPRDFIWMSAYDARCMTGYGRTTAAHPKMATVAPRAHQLAKLADERPARAWLR